MTMENFDRARYGAMSVADLAVAFEQLVGEPPEKKNKLWMLKRMEQSHSNRRAVERAAARARAGRNAGDSTETSAEPEADAEPAPAAESSTAATPPAADIEVTEMAPPPEPPPPTAPETVSPLVAEAPAPANEIIAPTPTTATDDAEAIPEEHVGATGGPSHAGETVRRKYVPARFKGKSIEELQGMYLQAVGRPTKSVDVPYIAWKIGLTERKGAAPSTTPRRARRVGAGRGEAKAVTLREYPDTLAAVEGVCTRHQFRNRLDFFRRAAHHFLEHLGEGAAAAYFAEMAPSDAPSASPS
jgi:hypothetical protein